MRTIFFRLLEASDKAQTLYTAIREQGAWRGSQRFEVDAASFSDIPRSPFAYWIGTQLRGLFTQLPSFESGGRSARQGLSTADDFRFVRNWWEVAPTQLNERWKPFAKGGKYSPYYSDLYLVLNWHNNGDELKAWAESLYGNSHWSRILKNVEFFSRPGITWPRRTQGGLSFRAMSLGCIFADKGPAAFVDSNDGGALLALLAITNSRPFRALIDVQMAFGSYEVGVIQRTPLPRLSLNDQSILGRLAHRAWQLKRKLDTAVETSHPFSGPAALQVEGDSLADRATAWEKYSDEIEDELTSIQADIDSLCFDLYGIDTANRNTVIEDLEDTVTAKGDELGRLGAMDDENDAESDEGDKMGTDVQTMAAELLSWTVGAAFGRFDIQLPMAADQQAAEHEPFGLLPACSPAILVGDDGLPPNTTRAGYPISIPLNGILVDDPGQTNDITDACRRVFDVIFAQSSDKWWNEVSAVLDLNNADLRTWINKSFFGDHLKRYSKNRRRAPIFWQLTVPSGRYSVWIYSHRLTRDTFFGIQNDVLIPKLAHESRQLASLTEAFGGNPSAKERKEISERESFVEEIRAFVEEIKNVATIWNSISDDGVLLAMAPLWRLVPHDKVWQTELKNKWNEFVAGKYDWAHLAMRLWPERVVPKCVSDRGLAIAHGLVNVFWMEGNEGKWTPRLTSVRPVEEVVSEHSSVAVKAALKALMEASSPNGPKTRTRRSSS
ncbi:MAG: hypothetical protein V4559_15660 [Pseudomonadota bacterium]